MGNETSGIAVLNLSSYNVHIGLSMVARHYYETSIKHGEIFYRRPGAVHYSVLAQTSPELSDERRLKETEGASDLGIMCAGVTIKNTVICLPALPTLSGPVSSLATPAEQAATANAKQQMILGILRNVPAADLHIKKMGCYGGGSGTWLVLRGGLKSVNGGMTHDKLRFEEVEPEYVLENGKFTEYSYNKFYSKEKTQHLKTAGHSCSRAACNLPS